MSKPVRPLFVKYPNGGTSERTQTRRCCALRIRARAVFAGGAGFAAESMLYSGGSVAGAFLVALVVGEAAFLTSTFLASTFLATTVFFVVFFATGVFANAGVAANMIARVSNFFILFLLRMRSK